MSAVAMSPGERTVARGPLVYFAFSLIKNNSQMFETGSVGLVETQLFFFLRLK